MRIRPVLLVMRFRLVLALAVGVMSLRVVTLLLLSTSMTLTGGFDIFDTSV